MTRRMVWYGIDLFANNGPDDGEEPDPRIPLPVVPARNSRNSPKRLKPTPPVKLRKCPGNKTTVSHPLKLFRSMP